MEQIFSRLFPKIKHLTLRLPKPHLCTQLRQYSLPWESLSTLHIKYNPTRQYHQYQISDEWKGKYLKQIASHRKFTWIDRDDVLHFWLGEIVKDENLPKDDDNTAEEE